MKRRSQRHYTQPDQRPATWADPLPEHRVENLHRITPTLYRSAQPRRDDVAALKTLGIKTVISLRSYNSDDRVFEGHPDIDLQRVRIDTWSLNDNEVLRALMAIREAERNGPVLIHCWHGADRTGAVAAVYRMALQDWTRDAARHEMFRGGFGYHTLWRNIPSYLGEVDVETMRSALAHT